jgi:hypothetical protein
MLDFVDLFDNREKALAIWSALLVAVLLLRRDLRAPTLSVVRALLAPALLTVAIVLLAYVALVVALLAWAGVWSTAALSTTTLWVATGGVAAFFAVGTNPGDPALVRRILGATIVATLVVEFLANIYVFSLVVELILFPSVVLVALLDAMARMKPEYAPTKQLTGAILIGFGLFLLIRTIWLTASDPSGFVSSVNAMRLVVPIALTIAFVLPAYILAVYALYDMAFRQIDVLAPDRRHAAVAKWTMARTFRLNRRRLARFSSQGMTTISRAGTRQGVEARIRDFEARSASATARAEHLEASGIRSRRAA